MKTDGGIIDLPWRIRRQRLIFCRALLLASCGHPSSDATSDPLDDQRPVASLAAKPCTLSSFPTYVIWCGSHIAPQYSIDGRTRALYRCERQRTFVFLNVRSIQNT